MENPTTWRSCRLSSPTFDRTGLMVGKRANRIKAVHLHSIRSSGTLRLSPTGRWREMRTNLRMIAPFVQMLELRRPVTPRHWRWGLHGKPNYVA
jgi:hypothetical protein